MNPFNIVRVIVVVTAAVLVGAFLVAIRFWPRLAGHNGNNLAIALPVICGLAILAPLAVKSAFKR